MPESIRQIVVKMDSMEELEMNMIASVWGKKQDDRFLADFLLDIPVPEFDFPG